MAKSYLLIITHSTDDPDRANSAIALAVSLLSDGADVALFFTFQGALLAKKGVAETVAGRNFTPVGELFPLLLEAQIPLYLCGACAKTYEIGEADLVPGVKIITLPTLAMELATRDAITL
ncbi:MAG TPA: DsrE family protein [Candidatus Methanoperedens sp.]|nr:DsrE family protein [Candidatus Methanoperedens sp.]